MRKRSAVPAPFAIPLMMTELTFASWETIMRRSVMMAQGTCSWAEYSRMVGEKLAAAQASALELSKPWSMAQPAAVLSPWHRRATVNARRLRRK
jgi:hypothetical protein